MKLIYSILISCLLFACSKVDQETVAMLQDKETIIIDVRSEEEYREGNIKRAINIPHDKILKYIEQYADGKDYPIVVYCRSGNRAGQALDALTKAGYSNVRNAGGLDDIKQYFDKE
ncbi:MAG: rhodanese-like domain-containing protein [Kangiellaceae bacterium]|jgi:phage shock protein E|nr:rhodanese-like domain-containing protein [Kangiellaceae bacterium]